MSLNQKLGQLFIIGLEGTSMTTKERDFIVRNNIGGVILFDRNCESPQQVHQLCTEIQALRHEMPDKAPLFISIDMEGGRVARLKDPFTVWPSAAKISALNSTSVAFKFGQYMGAELKAIGINVNFAPTVDVLTNKNNKVIGDRAFGDNPATVEKITSAVVRGYIKSDLFPCAKHFPGHGNTIIDSHEDLPVDDVSLEEMQKIMLPPFKKIFRARLDLVMVSHIKYTAIDADNPATLSEKIIKGLLREDLRYRQLVVTDDLDMKALRNYYSREEIPVKALNAGANILLYCNEPESQDIGFEAVQAAAKDRKLDASHLTSSYDTILEVKKKISNVDPPLLAEASGIVGCKEHLDLAQAINEGRIPEDITT